VVPVTSEERFLPAFAVRNPVPRTPESTVVLERSLCVRRQLLLDVRIVWRFRDRLNVVRALEHPPHYSHHVIRLGEIDMVDPSSLEALLEQALVDIPWVLGTNIDQGSLGLV
jgi:hypothetical protein